MEQKKQQPLDTLVNRLQQQACFHCFTFLTAVWNLHLIVLEPRVSIDNTAGKEYTKMLNVGKTTKAKMCQTFTSNYAQASTTHKEMLISTEALQAFLTSFYIPMLGTSRIHMLTEMASLVQDSMIGWRILSNSAISMSQLFAWAISLSSWAFRMASSNCTWKTKQYQTSDIRSVKRTMQQQWKFSRQPAIGAQQSFTGIDETIIK